MTQLQPLDPAQAIKMYLTERRAELSDDTLYNHSILMDFPSAKLLSHRLFNRKGT